MMLAVPVTASLLIILRQVLRYFYGESEKATPSLPVEEVLNTHEVPTHHNG
jgi:hypothetical protein